MTYPRLMILCFMLPLSLLAQTTVPQMSREVSPTALQAPVVKDSLVRPSRDSVSLRPRRDTTFGTVRAQTGAHRSLRDTMIRWNEDSLITAKTGSSDTVMRPGKSTTIALLSTMVVPGAGQIYNGAYWKAPVIWAFGAYFYSAYRTQNKNYVHYRDAYAATITPANTSGDLNIQRIRKDYYDDRNKFGWYMVITYLITMVDAYVDAAFYNFEVSPDLQPHGEWKATLHLRLP